MLSKQQQRYIWLGLFLLALLGSVFVHTLRSPLLFHRIYFGGTVLTMDPTVPVAQAVVTTGNKIVYVGDEAGALMQRRWYSTLIDLNGRTLMPGFIDAHSHFLASGLSSVLVDLNASPTGSVDTPEALYKKIAEASASADAGEWIVGFNYDNTRFPTASHPDRLSLDKVSANNPVYVRHHSGHMGVANSQALLRLLKFNSPVGGDKLVGDKKAGDEGAGDSALSLQRLDSDVYSDSQLASLGVYQDSDLLNGLLQEKMAPPLSRFLSELSLREYWRVFQNARDTYLRFGYTTVQEGSAGAQESRVLSWLSKLGILPMRVNVWLSADKLLARKSDTRVTPVRQRFFQSDTIKIIADGSPQGATAYLSKPYFNNTDSRGISLHSQDELAELIGHYLRAGFRVAVHANGDASIEDVINAVETLHRTNESLDSTSTRTDRSIEGQSIEGHEPQLILVHAQTIRIDQLTRLRELGITASFFSSHSWHWGDWHREQTLGEQRASRISPTGSAVRLQLDFTIHSDAPVTSPDPWHLLWVTTQRLTRSGLLLGADERIGTNDALQAMTINAAIQAGLQSRLGSISQGKLADMIIVNDNPLQVGDVRLVQVEETIVNGVSVYQSRPRPWFGHGFGRSVSHGN